MGRGKESRHSEDKKGKREREGEREENERV